MYPVAHPVNLGLTPGVPMVAIKTADNEKIPQTETPRRPAKAICTPQLPRLQGSLSLTYFYFLVHLLTLTPDLWC